jgi:hypothetical protein
VDIQEELQALKGMGRVFCLQKVLQALAGNLWGVTLRPLLVHLQWRFVYMPSCSLQGL